jgi:hypothetical protein
LQIRLAGIVIREKLFKFTDRHLFSKLRLGHRGGSFV